MHEGLPKPDQIHGQLDRLVERHSIDARIKALDVPAPDRPCVRAHFLYPAFKDRKPTIPALMQMLASEVTRFCATRSQRRHARLRDAEISELETSSAERLGAEARKLFITARGDSARSGEGGELLLYALVEHFLKAPLIVSKMRLKTNREMPVHGADGLHAAWCPVTNALILYFGESKMHKTFASAMKDAAESIAGLSTNEDSRLDQELRLISAFHDLDNFPAEGIEHLLRFLNPFETEEANRRIDRFAILIGFDYHAYEKLSEVPLEQVESTFVEHYRAAVSSKIETARGHLKNFEIELERVDLFLFPLPSVDDFRKSFEEILGA